MLNIKHNWVDGSSPRNFCAFGLISRDFAARRCDKPGELSRGASTSHPNKVRAWTAVVGGLSAFLTQEIRYRD